MKNQNNYNGFRVMRTVLRIVIILGISMLQACATGGGYPYHGGYGYGYGYAPYYRSYPYYSQPRWGGDHWGHYRGWGRR